jgi:hypothetical protein
VTVGIDRIKLGPKSRLAVPKEVQAEVEKVLAEATAGDLIDAVTRAIGCGCGAYQVETRTSVYVDHSGAIHRHGLPCYRVVYLGGKKVRAPVNEMDENG